MKLFLAIQSTYDTIELGIFEKERCLTQTSISKIDASKLLIPTLDALLCDSNMRYTDLLFCTVSQGPGPFTTLRTVIATMNGLSYATQIPLIGVNALEALIQEYDPSGTKNVCALLQAFSGDLYMGLRSNADTPIYTGVVKASTLWEHIDQNSKGELYCIGNGVSLYEDDLKKNTSGAIHLVLDMPHASLDGLARCGLSAWNNGDRGSLSIRPLYLKNYVG